MTSTAMAKAVTFQHLDQDSRKNPLGCFWVNPLKNTAKTSIKFNQISVSHARTN